MTGVHRVAVVAVIAVAVVLTFAPASEGDAMTRGLVRGSQGVVDGVRRAAAGTSRAVAGLCNRGRDRAAATGYTSGYTRRQSRDGSDQEADFVWRGEVEIGQTLQIKGVNGDIIAERAASEEIVVRVEKRARRGDVDDVRIEVVEHAGGVTLCAVYPSSRGRENTCEPGSGGHNSVCTVDRTGDVLRERSRERRVRGQHRERRRGSGGPRLGRGRHERQWRHRDFDNRFRRGHYGKRVHCRRHGAVRHRGRSKLHNGEWEHIVGSPGRRRCRPGRQLIEQAAPDRSSVREDRASIARVSRFSARGVLGAGGPELRVKTVNGSIHIF